MGLPEQYDEYCAAVRKVAEDHGVFVVDGSPCWGQLQMQEHNRWHAVNVPKNHAVMADFLGTAITASACTRPTLGWVANPWSKTSARPGVGSFRCVREGSTLPDAATSDRAASRGCVLVEHGCSGATTASDATTATSASGQGHHGQGRSGGSPKDTCLFRKWS